jgi:23S rRNA pseudouridine955/2504/2580 synthase
MPITGRMHQIRIHLASQRACIAGDDMYGGKPIFLSEIKRKYHIGKAQEELPIMKRFALHARKIKFHINQDTEMSFEAPYPKDFETLLKLLNKFDGTNQEV